MASFPQYQIALWFFLRNDHQGGDGFEAATPSRCALEVIEAQEEGAEEEGSVGQPPASEHIRPLGETASNHPQGSINKESELDEDLIGWRVMVYWEGEATWFSGHVIDVFIRPRKARKVKVLYDDGDVQDEKMKDIRWIAKVEEPEGDSAVGWRMKCIRESDDVWLPAIVTDSIMLHINDDTVQVMFQDGDVLKEAREEVLWISAPVRMGCSAKGKTRKDEQLRQMRSECKGTGREQEALRLEVLRREGTLGVLECSICMERRVTTVFTPCGHCYCYEVDCASAAASECFACRRPVVGRTRFYLG